MSEFGDDRPNQDHPNSQAVLYTLDLLDPSRLK